ncbi:hypothetical protein J4732_17915 [Serratia marcescens]|uniref:NERD domain-containing protein n=1 Tax=Serratia marcescens TaxID=615 RepID=A0A939SVF9_SERMA|nr:hypothetical protein [Serratia marcescens]
MNIDGNISIREIVRILETK